MQTQGCYAWVTLRGVGNFSFTQGFITLGLRVSIGSTYQLGKTTMNGVCMIYEQLKSLLTFLSNYIIDKHYPGEALVTGCSYQGDKCMK